MKIKKVILDNFRAFKHAEKTALRNFESHKKNSESETITGK